MVIPSSYADWFASTFGHSVPVPTNRICVSWPDESVWGIRAHCALVRVELEYVKSLLVEIKEKSVSGDIAEFGIFEGWWINHLWEVTEEIGLDRHVYGFDSFAGLSKPHAEFDSTFWREGQYACDLITARENVKATERPRIKLVKGFFADSLRQAEAQTVQSYSFARIDCDLYEPALQCLRYLGPRLSNGAILVFDDWPHRQEGEQKAFQDWILEVPHLRFEFLFYGTIGHFYLRVHFCPEMTRAPRQVDFSVLNATPVVTSAREPANESSCILELRAWAVALNEQIAQRDNRILELQKELEERDAWAVALNEEVAQKNNRVLALQNEIQERAACTKALNEEVAQRTNRIVEMQKEMEKLTADATRLQTLGVKLGERVAHKDGRILELQKEIEQQIARSLRIQNRAETRANKAQARADEAKARLDSMLSSRSWRITEPLRSLAVVIMKVKKLLSKASINRPTSLCRTRHRRSASG